MSFKIGILGNGYVGRATGLLKSKGIDCVWYDKNEHRCDPKGTKIKDLKDCDFVFVAVPTPMKKDGSTDLSILKSVIEDCVNNGVEKSKIIVRSTVPVGTCESLGVNFMPEFLTEKNWGADFKENDHRIFGICKLEENEKIMEKIYDLIHLATNNKVISECMVTFTSTQQAELAKYVRNAFLAMKVSFFNEIEEFCLKNDQCYATVRNLVSCDKRIGESHTRVPGLDGQRGYGGTCLPKDVNSLFHQMKKSKVKSFIVKAVKQRNENHDRPSKDWEQSKGRAVSYD
jgi:UDPglucose 6-dehydrogenase